VDIEKSKNVEKAEKNIFASVSDIFIVS